MTKKILSVWDYEQLLRGVFLCCVGKKKFENFFLNILASALKRCINNCENDALIILCEHLNVLFQTLSLKLHIQTL